MHIDLKQRKSAVFNTGAFLGGEKAGPGLHSVDSLSRNEDFSLPFGIISDEVFPLWLPVLFTFCLDPRISTRAFDTDGC